MTISDIAKIAGVSVSTVSKVLNNKDSNISSKTREKILEIAKEYNYTPYHSIMVQKAGNVFTLGVLIKSDSVRGDFLTFFLAAARRKGYSTIVYTADNPEEEYKNATLLSNQNVSGIVWERTEKSFEKTKKHLEKAFSNLVIIDYNSESDENIYIDYKNLGAVATRELVNKNHKKIICIKGHGIKAENFAKGFEHELFSSGIRVNNNSIVTMDHSMDDLHEILLKCSGIACSEMSIANRIYNEAKKKKYKIPEDISIVSLNGNNDCELPDVSYIKIPNIEFAEYACRRLIDKIEKRKNNTARFDIKEEYVNRGSVEEARKSKKSKLVVIGSLNIDYYLYIDKLPYLGETFMASKRSVYFGGKGLNQALGASKLGAEVHLLGRVGKDLDASNLYEFLYKNDISTEAVLPTTDANTGSAYIYVLQDGESGIIVYDGANGSLSRDDVVENSSLFESASYCLLNTEINYKAVTQAANIAKKKGVKTILKPAAINKITKELIRKIDYFIPNQKEAALLAPEKTTSIEEQADYFIEQGAKNVIITCGNMGYYVKSEELHGHFPAADFVAVDTTGASDAFISALATYLSKDYSLKKALEYANFVAGSSVAKHGVTTSLIDKVTMDSFFGKNAGIR